MYGLLLLALAGSVALTRAAFSATVSFDPVGGLRFAVKDEPDVTLVAVHFSINQPLAGVLPGKYNADIRSKTGNEWVHTHPGLSLGPGDTVNYWLYRIRGGLGEEVLGQHWTAPHQPCVSGQLCSVFREDFDSLDLSVWEHEITAGGGGNWEFEYYTNNRSNSYVRDSTLFIKPTLTADKFGEAFLSSGNLDLWGGCTNNQFYGCQRQGTNEHYLNPIQSARLRTKKSFSFRYGKLEVEAKMPTGDWIWPAIWMLPTDNAYGDWPASGEIDIIESRGNANLHDAKGTSLGVDTMSSTLHFGPYWPLDGYLKAHVETKAKSGTFGSGFHKYAVEWFEDSISFYVDGVLTKRVDPGPGGFWALGGFNKMPGTDNPWSGRGKIAPFDRKFHIVLNVAVGGTNGYFPDDAVNGGGAKPWRDASPTAARDFWQARNSWYPTWRPSVNNGEEAAMQIKSIQVYALIPM